MEPSAFSTMLVSARIWEEIAGSVDGELGDLLRDTAALDVGVFTLSRGEG